MFIYSTGIRNIKRQKSKSVINIVISIVLVLLLNIYLGNISSIKRQISSLPEAMPVYARVSNLNGTLISGIAIKQETIAGLRKSKYIKDPVFTIQLKIGIGEDISGISAEGLNLDGVGCNTVKAISGLRAEELSFIKGQDASVLDSNRKVCIVDQTVLELNKCKVGDRIPLTIYYYHYLLGGAHEIRLEPLITENYQIVASMDMHTYTGDNTPPSIVLPITTIEEAFDIKGLKFMPDSASFTVKDPFLLNELKKEMQGLKLLPVAAESEYQYDGIDLVIDDSTFIQAAEQLDESLTLLTVGLPFIIAIIAFIGYISAYLMIQNRRGEYAIMRSVGVKHREGFHILFFENAVLQLLGCIVGSLLAHFVAGSNLYVIVQVIGLYVVCYLTGTAVALWGLGRLSVMEVLTKHE